MMPVPSAVVRTLQIEVPQFVRLVDRTGEDEIALPWAMCAEDPALTYNCLWYALSKGKRVLVEPGTI